MDMLVYLNIIFILAGMATFIDITSLEDKYKKRLLLSLFFLCWCVTPIFSEIEPLNLWSDRVAYKKIFEYTPPLTEWFSSMDQVSKIHGEYGFLFLIALIKTIIPFSSSYVFFIIFSTIALTLNYHSIMYFENLRFNAFLGYYAIAFVNLDLYVLRTGMAVAIIFYSLRFVVTNKIFNFLICYLLACSIHISAAPSLLIYSLRKVEWNYFRTFILILLLILLEDIQWINKFAVLINDSRLDMYVNEMHPHSVAVDIFFKCLFGLFILLISIRVKKENTDKPNPYYIVLQNMLVLSIIFNVLFAEIFVLGRMVKIMESSKYFLLPMILMVSLKNNKYKEVIRLVFILIIILIWFRFYSNNGLEVVVFS